ncbi:serine/threonine protein kinase [Leptolyngbya sp. AN02str]|uniref:serine/threonine protein kinase n=1 Tax=Leptolyngbya sp. AN02str TaxID=3423363 RepID=UPI003D31FA08
MVQTPLQSLISRIHQQLLPHVQLESFDVHNPVVVSVVPAPWELLGTGNYAAVFCHPDFPEEVVKIYAPGRPGWHEEVEVYRRLGEHPAFSSCLYAEPSFLVLKRLYGVTLYDCVQQGLYIPKHVIQDIDAALAIAKQRGLHPHDVHGRNVMMWQGRGFVVDISDFLNPEPCQAWDDLKRAYYWLYRPVFSWLRLRVPRQSLDAVRWIYRRYRNYIRRTR